MGPYNFAWNLNQGQNPMDDKKGRGGGGYYNQKQNEGIVENRLMTTWPLQAPKPGISTPQPNSLPLSRPTVSRFERCKNRVHS